MRKCSRLVPAYLLYLMLGWPMLGVSTSQAETGQHGDPVQYIVSFADADRHIVEVSATIPANGKPAVELMLPVWTPGSYLVREYARNIESIAAFHPLTLAPLELRKQSKNRWQVDVPKDTDAIRLTYRLYCREMSVRTNYVEHDFGVLVGAATFITNVDSLAAPHHVQFILPTQWQQAITSMPTLPGPKDTFRAENFDVLVDSPVVLGNPKVTQFTVSDKPHLLVTLNDGGLWDNDKAAADVKRIVEAQHKFWGTVPYEKYIFLNVVGEAGGGLEHDNSTLIMTSRWTYGNPERYLAWLGLVSHEFFHTWNVRRLRPKVLAAYNYEQENYFNELWISEGLTSFYDDLLQVHAGLLTEADYFKRLSRSLSAVESIPGNKVQSLADSSFDSWIKFYRPDENDANTRVNYYTKGALVAWVLDAKVRDATSGNKSLQDIMRLMYERFALDKGGFTLDDFGRVVDEVAGQQAAEQPLSQWLTSVVEDTLSIDYTVVLKRYGLQMGEAAGTDETPTNQAVESKEQPEQPEQPDANIVDKETGSKETESDSAAKVKLAEAATAKPPKTPYHGATVRDQGGKMVVTRVLRGSPADLAGWNVDDELLALGEYRVTESLLSDYLAQFPVGVPIESLLSRRGQLLERKITLKPHEDDNWKLSTAKQPTAEQKEHRKQWLNQPN